jgi:hypothetical protein
MPQGYARAISDGKSRPADRDRILDFRFWIENATITIF